MEEFFIHNSPWIFLLYIFFKEASPIVRSVLDKTVPAKLARNKSLAERVVEVDEKRLDLRERETIAMESINTALILLKNNSDKHNEQTITLMDAISTANQGLAVLLDRNKYYREEDVSKDKG